MTNLDLFDRWGNQRGRLKCLSAVYEEALGGTSTLEVETLQSATKGDRIVWVDSTGVWHEQLVDVVRETHADGAVLSRLSCIDAVAELYWDDFTGTYEGMTINAILQDIASRMRDVGARWSLSSDIPGTWSFDFFHQSVREILKVILDTVGYGELVTTYTRGTGNALIRSAALNVSRGDGIENPKARYTWGANVYSLSRELGDRDPVTAIVPLGKAGEDGHRLTIAGVNDGVTYVENVEARSRWGQPTWDGQQSRTIGTLVVDSCDDPAVLMQLGTAYLAQSCTPDVTYTLDTTTINRAVKLGDWIHVVDTYFEPELRLAVRVSRLRRDLLLDAKVVTGSFSDTAAAVVITAGKPNTDKLLKQIQASAETAAKTDNHEAQLARLSDVADQVTELPASYMDKLNQRQSELGYNWGEAVALSDLYKIGHKTDPYTEELYGSLGADDGMYGTSRPKIVELSAAPPSGSGLVPDLYIQPGYDEETSSSTYRYPYFVGVGNSPQPEWVVGPTAPGIVPSCDGIAMRGEWGTWLTPSGGEAHWEHGAALFLRVGNVGLMIDETGVYYTTNAFHSTTPLIPTTS